MRAFVRCGLDRFKLTPVICYTQLRHCRGMEIEQKTGAHNMSSHSHSPAQQQEQTSGDDAARQIEAFRRQKDKFFKEAPESPLLAEDKESFHGLNYYPVAADFRVTATLVPDAHPGTFRVQTTTGDFKEYTRMGRLEFKLGEQTYSLTAFIPPADEPMHGNRIFVPFRDKTAGKETYG